MANLEEVFLDEKQGVDEKSSNGQSKKETNKSKDILVHIPDTDRVIACMEHGILDDYAHTVIFLPGAGFGRTNNPDYNNILTQLNIRLIIVDRPGYGLSTPHPTRTYQTFANDLFHVLKYFNLHESKNFFLAHSAGCPHLLSFCNQYPNLVAKAAIVCSPNPLVGKAPIDRPVEPNCGRSCQRCCALNFLCCLTCCMNPLLSSWEKNPKEFEKFTLQQLKAPQDKQFYQENNQQMSLFIQQFGDAVHPPNGKEALYLDMLGLPVKNWGFSIRDIGCSIQVWYGDADEITPNGNWFVNTLQNAKGFEQNGYGHALIYCKFDKIIEILIEE